MSKRALICGISGQDGAYLARLLLENGYEVFGTSRDAEVSSFANLIRVGIRDQVRVFSMAVNDFRSVLQVLSKTRPDEIYNLAGQSSVGLSFEQPIETLESVTVATFNLLESIRFLDADIRFYNAASSECFGDVGDQPANEQTPFSPRSPYAVAKVAAFQAVKNYREAYGLRACSGILFNHESVLRPERFVTQKIVRAACRIAHGSQENLRLGNLDVARDWGWAPEYVVAMWKMLQQDRIEDYVIATGESNSLRSFVEYAFASVGLDWQRHVVEDKSLLRPSDNRIGRADPSFARERLDWSATLRMRDVIKLMIEAANVDLRASSADGIRI